MPLTESKNESGLAKTPKMTQATASMIEFDNGWAHVVGGRVIKPDANKVKLEKGDFQINGAQYRNKTFDQVSEEYDDFKKTWEESTAAAELIALLSPYKGNKQLRNVVVMGLGSFQSTLEMSNRTSYTQLAALTTIMTTLGMPNMPVALQDPAFSPLDKEFLESLGHQVAEHPYGFSLIDAGTLVYAIHCHPSVYDNVGKRATPAVFIANNLKERGILAHYTANNFPAIEPLYTALQSLFPMPKLRGYFSATVFYCSKDFSREV